MIDEVRGSWSRCRFLSLNFGKIEVHEAMGKRSDEADEANDLRRED